ncbi:MAG: zinc ribbon domain-containing protein [Serratia liquefaciens]|jgi:DNA-directed RNA polymerase subunit RPC12/RpoP|nr:zinc ribbon domain-containing protein [Serratia liquefaciens]MCH4234039.1 zinc ribbon domain-containing protein [Serratia liquefaciens]MCH4261590.1 zinc ribbon domain-containing protein [Serratia liquefaciens]MCI1214123.1 zinc ribbon domain-containing protein [Serratia liquefaciens]MCI1235476.1 zinc ribbon domain-containing protein [Serratia liquefaciens]
MRTIGFLLLAVGVIWLLIAFNMDTSVATGYGERVNNIGLIASKQNHMLIASVVSLGAILMVIFGRESSNDVGTNVKCPYCAERIKSDAIKCKHCGSDVAEKIKAQDESKFSFNGFDFSSLLSKQDGLSLIDDEVKSLADKIKSISQSKRASHIFGEHQSEITFLKYKLPSSVQSDFIKRLKYWLAK